MFLDIRSTEKRNRLWVFFF